MIEPDINERMARFAPSQNQQDPMGLPPQALEYARSLRVADDASMKSTMLAVRKVNPDEAARAAALGNQIGVGADIAVRNMDEVEQRAYMQRLAQLNLSESDPTLARFLANRKNAMVAHDDVEALHNTRGLFSDLGMTAVGIGSDIYQAITEGTAPQGVRMAPQAFEAGVQMDAASREAARLRRLGRPTEQDRQRVAAMRQAAGELMEEAGGGIVTGGAMLAGQMKEPLSISVYWGAQAGLLLGGFAAAGAPISGGSSLLAVKPAMGLGFTAGFTASMVRDSYENIAGIAYMDMLDSGISEENAQFYSGIAGIAGASLEVAGQIPFVGQGIKAAGLAVGRRVADRVIGRGAVRAAGTAVKDAGLSMASEGLTEGGQVVTDAVALHMAQRAEGMQGVLDTPEGRQKVIDDAVDEALMVVEGMTLLSLPLPLLNFAGDVRRFRRSQQRVARLQQAINAVSNSKTAQRDPDAVKELIDARTEGNPDTDLYIDGAQMDVILRQSEVDPRSLDGLLPGFSERLAEAVAIGGDIRMTQGEFLPKLALTETGKAMTPHLRIGDPKDMNLLQQELFKQEQAANIEAIKKAGERAGGAAKEFVDSLNRVEDQIVGNLEATGQYKADEIRAFTTVQTSVVARLAPQLNMTPEQFWAEYRNEIVGYRMAQQVAQQQAAQFNQMGQRRTDTPEFKAWNERPADQGGMNKLVEPNGEPIRFYHGTQQGGFTAFDPSFLGTGAGYSRGGFSFVNSRERAQAYAERGDVDTRVVNEQIQAVNQILREPGMAERFAAAGLGDGIAYMDGEPMLWDALSDEEVREGLQQYIDAFRQVGDADMASRLGDILDMTEPRGVPQVYEVYLYAGQNVREVDATPETIGDVLAGIDVRSQPGGAVIVNMPDGERMVIVSDPRNIKSTDNRGTFSRETADIMAQQPVAPPPDAGIFDVNNPPAPTDARLDIDAGGPVVALMDYDGNVYYDRNASMHGDLLETFPELEADMVIDGGFIIDGKYRPGMSDGGFAAGEAGPEMVQRVRELTERVNTPTRLAQEPVAQPGPIEAAKALVAQSGRETFTDADEFFKKRWASLLKRTKRTVKPVPSNFREAARRAVNDMLDFVKDNPKFADYYEKDWALTRQILDDYIGRPITNDEFAMFRVIAGLTSPNTLLSSNISDTVGLWNHWMEFRNFDAFTLGPKPGTGALVLFEAAEPISGTTANVKLRTIQIIEQLVKDKGSVTDALAFLQEGVPVSQLHKFNRRMGYSGAVGDIGNITSLVKQATGQDKLIPRMFIFGQKVGAYTLNAIGDSRYTTVDIWESRYIRSHFTGMFEANIGLPETSDEHRIFTRFGELFNEEMERVTGRKWAPSALQALRWFYIIETARNAGYSKASTNETISFYTERKLAQSFGYRGLGAAGRQPGTGAVAAGAGAGQVPAARIPPKRFERDLTKDVEGIEDARERKRRIAAGYVGYARYNSERGRADFRFDERRLGSPRPHGVLTNAQVVADYVPGAQMVRAYSKAGLPTATIQELATDAASAQAFRDLVLSTNEQNQYGAAVYAYSADEYQGKRLFVTEDGTAGFALSPDGDIVSVFSAPKSGNGRSLMALSVQVGGTKLDCFDTALPGYYAAHGFRAVARLPWSDQYAPAGWDKQVFAQYNKGEPAVVFMVYQPGYMGAYKAGAGATVASYDDGVAAQAKAIEAERRATSLFQQPMEPSEPQGTFDIKDMMTRLNKGANIYTLIHESGHYWLEVMGRISARPDAPERIAADYDRILQWFGIAGATAQERAATWNGMTLDQKRPHHEAFARNIELYMAEGKAPSLELQPAFERFMQWMKRFYVSMRDQFNEQYKREFGKDMPMFSVEMREVMERLLASDEQIERAKAVRNAMALFDVRPEGLTDAEWQALQDMQLDADIEALATMRAEVMKSMKWLRRAEKGIIRDMQKETDERRAEVRAEVAESVAQEPVYRARQFLSRGTYVDADGNAQVATNHRLDIDAVRQMYELEPENLRPDLSKLGTGAYGMMGKGGMNPEVAAEMFGYDSADAMIRDLIGAPALDEAIEAQTDRRMLAENGTMNTPAQREEAIDRALHGELRARLIATQLRLVAKAMQPVRVLQAAARQVARQLIGNKRLRDIRVREYVAAESRAARDGAEAYRGMPDPKRAGDAAYTRSINEQMSAVAAGMPISEAEAIAEQARQAAVDRANARRDEYRAKYPSSDPDAVLIAAKRNELLNHELAREAIAAQDEVDKAIVKFRRLFKADADIAKTRNMDKVMAARAILAAFGLGRSEKSILDYMAQIEKYDPDMYAEIAPIINAATRGAVGYRDLTLNEFRSVRDAVEALWYNAKRDREIVIEGKAMQLEAAVSELTARLDELGAPRAGVGMTHAVTWTQKRWKELLQLKAMITTVESWSERMDAQRPRGPFTMYIWRPVKGAIDAYLKDKAKYIRKFDDALKKLVLPVQKIQSDELGYTFGAGNGGIGKAEVLGAMLHMGNESNLRKLLLGRGWGELDADGNLVTARWDAFVTRMFAEGIVTKADMDFLQEVWDLNEEIKPLAQKAHQQIFGYYFKEIDASAVVTPFGTYRGGYVPAKQDTDIVPDAAIRSQVEQLEADFRNAMPSTGFGFTFSRVDYNVALSLDARMVMGHVDSVLRFAHIQPAIKDVLKVVNNRDFKAAMNGFDEAAIKDMLLPWMNRAARQSATESIGWAPADRMFRGLRSRTGVSIMMGNIKNTLENLTGLSIGLYKVDPKSVRRGAGFARAAMAQYLNGPGKLAQAIADASPFMADRMNSQIFEMANEIDNILRKPNAYNTMKAFFARHAYFMQIAVQNVVDSILWTATYNRVIADARLSLDPETAHNEAVAQADSVIRLTQSSMRPEDMAAFEAGTPFYQSFTQFMAWSNRQANLQMTEWTVIMRDLGWRSNKGRMFMLYLLTFAIPSIMTSIIAKTVMGRWEDEDDDGHLDTVMEVLLGSQVRMGVGMIPGGAYAYPMITGGFTDTIYDDKVMSSPAMSTLTTAFVGTGKLVTQIFDPEKDVNIRNVKDALTLVNLLFGIPVDIVGRRLAYAIEVEQGKIEPTGTIDYLRGLATGTASEGTRR